MQLKHVYVHVKIPTASIYSFLQHEGDKKVLLAYFQ